jgi:hypothetical protein
MFKLVIVIWAALQVQPQVIEKPFDKLADCEVAAHTYLVNSSAWPKGATAVGAGCKIAVQPKKIDVP